MFLQNVAISTYGLHWKRRRYGGAFESALWGFKERESYSKEQWRSYIAVELCRLVSHAYETVPYYYRTFSAAGFTADDFRRFEPEDLRRLPFLDKEDLRRFGRTDLVSSKRERGGVFFPSSGTTGTPTSILYSHAFHQRWSAAFEARIRHWAGLDRRMPRGMIGGRRIIPEADAPPPYFRYNRWERQAYFSAYHISHATAPNYLEGMSKHGVEYMTGYAMGNHFLAGMLRDLSLEAPALRAVVTSSEKLTPAMRELFRTVYGCPTFDSYSGLEACGLVSENEHGELVVSPDVGIMELLDGEGREVEPGEMGEVVSTGLLNFDQPLIRYRIGDEARRSRYQTSKSGVEMPLIEEICGRIEDKVVGPDGREMVRFHSVFFDIPHLVAAQVVQEALDRLTVRVVVEPDFSTEDETTITNRVRSQLGDVSVAVDRVEALQRNAAGKVRAVISELPAR